MTQNVIIVEDFYAQPLKLREMALQSRYADISATDYPGYASQVRLETKVVERTFSKLVGAPLLIDRERFTWGGFRFITAQSGSKPIVHADVAADWAGMVYLTPDCDMAVGTGLYRHKDTGLTGPPNDREARALGYCDAATFDEEVIQKDKADLSKWELCRVIEPVFNRLVLFRGGDNYHAPLGGCGDEPKTARLTHLFFFNERPGRPLRSATIKCADAGEFQPSGGML
jgi:hypothetical protein